jgi:glucosyl-3-phosphoglycerate synthase
MDFKQEYITTLHDLRVDPQNLKKKIEEATQERPVSIVIPMLHSELKNDTLRSIINELNKCTYIKEVIIALAAKNQREYQQVTRFFSNLDIPHLVVWCSSPNIEGVLYELKDRGLNLFAYSGKGRDVWIALGIATIDSYAVALHDADIVTYTEMIPTKLLYPLVEPDLSFYFNKGYYARINSNDGTLYGRVFRLFVQPLIHAFADKIGYKSEFLRYLQAYRYPIAGEFAITSDLALDLNIPGDWGLEIGILSEIHRDVAIKRICQTDLGLYEHKHQKMGDHEKGLIKMANDIFRTLLRTLAETVHLEVSEPFLLSFQPLYKKHAIDCIRQYYATAMFNGLPYNRHAEESIVDKFTKVILRSGKQYLNKPIGMTIPDWQRTRAAMKNIREKLLEAAIRDKEKFG